MSNQNDQIHDHLNRLTDLIATENQLRQAITSLETIISKASKIIKR